MLSRQSYHFPSPLKAALGARNEYCVTDPHFPASKNRHIDPRALFVLLGNAAKNGGARLCARRIERDHHATLVDFRDRDPRSVSHAKNPADLVQLIERFATLQIDEQVRTQPQGIFFNQHDIPRPCLPRLAGRVSRKDQGVCQRLAPSVHGIIVPLVGYRTR